MGKRRENILLVTIVCFWFALYVYIPYQTPYLTALGVSAGTIGTVVGSYGVMQLLLRLPVGVMADYAGRHKPFVILGAALTGLACAVRFLIPEPGDHGVQPGNVPGICIQHLFLCSDKYALSVRRRSGGRSVRRGTGAQCQRGDKGSKDRAGKWKRKGEENVGKRSLVHML